jgi:hypothetical protein
VTGPLRDHFHLGYRVPKGKLEDLMAEADEVLLGPRESVKDVLWAGFAMKDGACIEYLEYIRDPEST